MERDPLFEIFHASHGVDPQLLRRLRPAERERLQRMVRGELPSPSRPLALAAWFELAPEGAAETFAALMRDPQPALRATAATYVGRLAAPDAPAVLQQALQTEREPLVRIKIVAALGRVGTPDNIAAVSGLTGDRDAALARQARFTLLLIGHRHGLADHQATPSDWPPVRLRATMPIEIVPARREDIAGALATLRGDTFGMLPSSDHGAVVDCLGQHMVLVLNASSSRDLLGEARARPTILGVVALRSEIHHDYSTSRVVLAGPAGRDVVHFAVYRLDGTLVHQGTGRWCDDHWEVQIVSVEASGNTALDLRLQVERGALRVIHAATGSERISRRHPTPFTPPG